MIAFILGLVALILGLVALEAFMRANPLVLARRIRRAGAAVLAVSAVLVFLRGFTNIAVLLGSAAFWLAARHRLGTFGGQSSPGQTSRVATDHLEMELDHDTGAMTGRVLKGVFQGRAIEDLTPEEMALLWQDCRFSDPQSARLIEAYLDRMHPSWREDMARGEEELARGPDGRMGPEEAMHILGLKTGATEEDIRRAHRELMMKLHPDRGGSTYLAAKINEAKAVLLDE